MYLHSSGGWSTDDELGAGPREHWGPPGSLAVYPQPLKSQRSHQVSSPASKGTPSIVRTCLSRSLKV